MKGVGNYRFAERRSSTERRVGTLLSIQGNRASVRFLDGQVFAMPAEPFALAQVRVGDRFVLVSVYEGKRLREAKVERNDARPASPLFTTPPLPKVQVRDNGKVVTRR